MKSTNNSKQQSTFLWYKSSKLITKLDILLLSILVVVLVICSVYLAFSPKGAYAEIYHKGRLIGSYQLDKDTVIDFDNANHHAKIAIKSGKVSIMSTECPNKICQKMGEIDAVSERIVCLPYQLTIVIKGKNSSKFDAITGGQND